MRALLLVAVLAAILGPATGAGLALPPAGGDAPVSIAAATGELELAPAPRVSSSLLLAPSLPNLPLPSADASMTRQEVVNLYNSSYLPALAVPSGWTGSIAGCMPGTTSAAYEAATLQTVSYFRTMAGLPANITFDGTLSNKDRQTALMMIAQGQLSHTPSSSFACYTADGAEAAGNSNLAIGAGGPAAIRGYIEDPGAGNEEVGHRRWILFPPQAAMGTGSTTGVNNFFTGSNALWTTGQPPGTFGFRPPSPEFVAWPPPGFVPYQLAFSRWSFAYNQAQVDFSGATVSMSRAGSPVTLTTLALVPGLGQNFFIGDNTIVWEPQGITGANGMPDTTYTVIVSNVKVSGVSRTFTYNVTLIDPAIGGGGGPTSTPTRTPTVITGGATPTTTIGFGPGGRGFGISSSTAGTTMTWQPGLGQSGYQVLAFLPTGPVTIPAGGLPAGATAFFDSRPFGGSVCYMLVPVAGASALGRSDFLCWLANTLTSVGAPQNFTMRLNESNTATFTWTGPLGGGQTSYVLVPFGGQPITLPGTATSATAPATPGTFARYALLALQGQSTMGFTNVHCGFAGLAQL